MRGVRSWWRRQQAHLLAGVVAPGLLAISGGMWCRAAEPLAAPQPTPAATIQAPVAIPVDLVALRKLALEKQPTLAAYRASVTAAEQRLRGMEQLRLLTIVRHDLPTRVHQAEQGVIAAESQLHQAEGETLYAVTRNYFTAIYAQQQLAIAVEALSNKDRGLLNLKPVVDDIVKGKNEANRPDLKKWNALQVDILIQTTKARQAEAERGLVRGLAALREAIGLEADCPLQVTPGVVLPELPDLKFCCADIVNLALARHPAIVRASIGIEVTALEIKAQDVLFLRTSSPTFASGSDLHVQPIPQGLADGEYRPGAIGLEMPPNMNGCRSARVGQASTLHERAQAVFDKTRQLITLEAEDAFHRYEQAASQYRYYQVASKLADQAVILQLEKNSSFLTKTPEAFGPRPTLDDILDIRSRAVMLRIQVNQSHYEALLALAALERITAGGICPVFVPPTVLTTSP